MTQDFRRCGPTVFARLREFATNPAMWAVFGYRVRRFVVTRLPRPVRWVLAPLTIPLQVGTELLTHIQLSSSAQIGIGLQLPHLGTIVIGAGSRVGDHCVIAHNVTVGHGGGRCKAGENPVIGNRVYIGPGAIVIGPVKIGDDALIGAGAVVVKSVPPRGVVVGNPARIIGRDGSFELVNYPHADEDKARVDAMAEVAIKVPDAMRNKNPETVNV